MTTPTDSVFGPLGGGQQHGTDLPQLQDGPRNGNPSGDGVSPRQDSVFGDLGGPGVAGQHGGGTLPSEPGQGGN